MKPIEGALKSADGTGLFYRRWAVDSPWAVVAIIHGYADHSGRYEHVAAFLNAAEIDVWALDLRGHGRSEGKRGHIARFSDYLDDVDALLAKINPGEHNFFLIGHSMGGLVTLSHAIARKPRCRGIAVSCPFLGVAIKVPAIKVALGKIMSRIYPSLALPSGIDPANLSHDVSVGEKYKEDKLVFNTATARWYTETMKAVEIVKADAHSIKLPALILQAEDDRLVDPLASKPVFDSLGSKDKKFIFYPRSFHEIFNEIDRSKPLTDLKDWILNHL